jgi:phospholipid/cholesterol/gamma-HCH transport system permease protein
MLDLSPKLFYDKMLESLAMMDLRVGAIKSVVFGVIVGLVGLAQGLQVRGGAEGVGKATTNAVVYSIILIIVVDCLLTIYWYF